MRIIIFAVALAILLATTSFAEGLEITKLDVHVDYDYSTVYRIEQEHKSTRTDAASVPIEGNPRLDVDVFPGSNLTFMFTVENTFKDATQTLRDISIKMTIEGKHGKKLEKISGDFSLEPGNAAKIDVTFNIPFDIGSGLHSVLIEAEGTGKNHTSIKTNHRLNLDISKLSHDVRITEVLLKPSIVDCKRNLQLTAEIINAGSIVENEVALEFKSAALGINSFDSDIPLEPYNEAFDEVKIYTKTLDIQVPSFFKAGTYPISVNLYWQNFILFDQKTVQLTVKDCKPGAAKTNPQQEMKNQTLVAPTQPTEETKQVLQERLLTTTEEVSILDSPILFSMLLGGALVIIILATLVVFGLLKKSRAQ